MGNIFSIAVDNIPDAGLHLVTSWDANALVEILEAQQESFKVISPVDLDISFLRSAETVIAEGMFQLHLELQCVRCLTTFVRRFYETFHYILVPQASQQARRQTEEDELELAYYSDEVIDIRPLIREQIYLAMPDYPHCSEDCKGLCQHCGANLNERTCTCMALPEWTQRFRIRISKKQK